MAQLTIFETNMQLRQPYVQYRNKPLQLTTFGGISFKMEISDKCRVCHMEKETIHHVIMEPYEGDYSPSDNWYDGYVLQSFQN